MGKKWLRNKLQTIYTLHIATTTTIITQQTDRTVLHNLQNCCWITHTYAHTYMGVHVSKHDYYFWFYLLIHVSFVCLLFSMQRNKGSQSRISTYYSAVDVDAYGGSSSSSSSNSDSSSRCITVTTKTAAANNNNHNNGPIYIPTERDLFI